MSFMPYELQSFKWPIKAWPILQQLLNKTNSNIAGGYACWHMSEKYNWNSLGKSYNIEDVTYDRAIKTILPACVPSDIDIFTYDMDSYNKIVDRLNYTGFKILAESKYCTTWEDAGNFLKEGNWNHLSHGLEHFSGSRINTSTKRMPIQAIKPVFGDNVFKVLDHFDFYMAKIAAIDDKMALVHTKALEHLESKNLASARPEQIIEQPFHVLSRYLKYIRKGYKVNYMDLYRIVTNARAAEHGLNMLETEQLRELVVDFGKYIHSGELMVGRGEDFRPDMEEAYGVWLNCLQRKKSVTGYTVPVIP